MIRHSLKSKIITPTIIILSLLVIVLTAFSSIRFANFVNVLFDERIAVTANGLQTYLHNCERASRVAAVSLSTNTDVVKAIKERDTNEIIRVITPALELYHVDFCTVTDGTGVVLARTHIPDNHGDSVSHMQNIRDSIEGRVSTHYEEGASIQVSVRTGSPVHDTDGALIGIIMAGVRLDTNESLDKLKELFGADFSIFVGDTRTATSIVRDGERIIGTQLDPEIAKTVYEDKKEYFGNTVILGENYGVYYLPLINPLGKVLAVLCAGHPNTHFIAEENKIIHSGIFIGLLGLAISVIVLWLIISKSVKPVNQLTHLVSEVVRGNVDVEVDRTHITGDEIGTLILDIHALIDINKSMVSDLTQLIKQLDIYGDMDLQIDSGKYSGVYQEIIDGIKTLVDSISTMNKVMTAMDSLDTMILVIDFDYHLTYINRSLANTFGVNMECYKGKKCYQALRNLDQPCSFCLFPEMLSEKDTLPSRDYEFLYDEVCHMWLGGRASIIRWVDGSLVFFQALNDETEIRKTHEQLSEAVEAAEAASTAKSAFLANMSHELRTPLNVVVGLSDLQLENNGLPDETRENLHKISCAGNTLLSIVNDILDISKIESGKFALTPVEYHLASLLNDTAILITSRIGEKPVTFRLDISESLPGKLYGDDLRVKQILNNLLSNAIKYTQEGTIELGIHCFREGDNDVWMEIAVKDTGIGIRQENLKELFADFKQVDTQANRKIEGTGLGLAITRRLVESMDGRISVESEYGRGSTFHARIRQGFVDDTPIGPVVVKNLRHFRYNDNKRHFASNLVREDLSFAKVLIVDDMQTNLDVAAGLMRKYKMQVDCVTSGQAAIERIKRGEPVYDAIFMDHMMPEMDGIEAAERIRSLGTAYVRTVPIIALTANAIAGTEELFYEHGFQAFLTKPIDVMRLDSILLQWIKNKSNGLPLNESREKPEEEKPTIDIPGVDAEKGISICGGDQKIYLSVLRSYVADMSTVLDKLRDVTAETLPDYAIAVHGIKGSSANIGAEAIRQKAANLEIMAKNGDLQGILAENDVFLRETEHLVTTIKDRLASQDAKIVKPRLPAPDLTLLTRLLQCCEDGDLEEAEKIMAELDSASYENDAELVISLKEKIDTFDLEEAAGLLAGHKGQ